MEIFRQFGRKNKQTEIKTGEERRKQSNDKIKAMGIACLEQLPMLDTADQIKLRGIDEICKRAVACLLSTQIACDIGNGEDYEESRKLIGELLEKFGVKDCLNSKEERLFDGSYSMQDALDVTWTYEAYWSLVWSLGLVEDISDASEICDCEEAIRFVGDCDSYEIFKRNCKIRDAEEILDMLDLYYRYDWACTEKRIRPDTPIGNLNPEVVTERRRGLEWLISDEDDWFAISLDT